MMTGPEYCVNTLTPAVNQRMTPKCCGAVMCNIAKENIKKKQSGVMEVRTGNPRNKNPTEITFGLWVETYYNIMLSWIMKRKFTMKLLFQTKKIMIGMQMFHEIRVFVL